MNNKKLYYLTKDIYGCLGATGKIDRLVNRYTNKKDAIQACNLLKSNNTNNRIIYGVDFLWV